MNILYITYDGITDHIGQSQVAPYLLGLVAKGHQITLLSAEKMERQDIIEKYKQLFQKKGVEWHYVAYHKKPPVVSTVMDLAKMQAVAKRLIAKNKITVVHCRSYVASLIGLHFKKKLGIRFIFDMRDFWPDAAREIKRFDVEHNRIHRAVYRYFKKKEKEFIEQADHIISLTESGKRVIQSWDKQGIVQLKVPISVIPCCADFSAFDRSVLDDERVKATRARLGIGKNEFVLNYLGSLGPSYLTDEMMDVFKVLLEKRPNARFLIVANNDHHLAVKAAQRKGIDTSRIIVTKGTKEDVPYLIAQSDLSLFFIIPSFAKQACSPTKLAELLAMNVPVISNTRVGDLDTILSADKNNSAVVKEFSEAEYERVLELVLAKIEGGNEHLRANSQNFSLETGIELYHRVYQLVTSAKAVTEWAVAGC